MPLAVSTLNPGDIISGKYRLVEELGRGSYGVVFRAIQLGIEREVALKTLLPKAVVQGDEGQRFEREARLVSRLTHPNIITLFDYGEHEGVLYMVMEFIEGRSLGELIKQEAPLPAPKVRALVYQMLDALQYAHDQGVVHRDLKPENIWIIRSHSMQHGTEELVKILDFGIAKVMQRDAHNGSPLDTLTQTGFVLGTPQYMSPENITGDPVTHQADLYAMGLMIFEMLTGKHAFVGATPNAVMVSHLCDDPPTLAPELGAAAWQRGIDMCLVKQPDERVESARELRAILEHDETNTARPPVVAEHDATRRPATWAIALALFLIASLLIVMIVKDEPTRPVSEPIASVVPSAPIAAQPVEPIVVEEPDEMHFEDEDVAVRLDATKLKRDPSASEDGEQSDTQTRPATREPDAVTTRRPDKLDETAAAPRERVKLSITSLPESARVTLDGRPIGTTPLVYSVARSEAGLKVGFSLIGYRDADTDVVPSEDRSIEVRLEKGRLQLRP
ncbi:MAG: serine/threonine protein kinase [Bradymonadaceae bacterium]|nr:serine/threonine protein kinase [Lujinxingiaceae bacterium]